ncbi:MAG: hypothetical protein ABUT20_58020, partial [Bacteroidota bacterium]
LFWDAPLETIDIKLHKNYIIERVLLKGFLQDFYFLLKIYSHEEITAALRKSRVLDKKTANFCSYYFNVPINELYASPYHS